MSRISDIVWGAQRPPSSRHARDTPGYTPRVIPSTPPPPCAAVDASGKLACVVGDAPEALIVDIASTQAIRPYR